MVGADRFFQLSIGIEEHHRGGGGCGNNIELHIVVAGQQDYCDESLWKGYIDTVTEVETTDFFRMDETLLVIVRVLSHLMCEAGEGGVEEWEGF